MTITRYIKSVLLCLALFSMILLGGARDAYAVGDAYFPQDTTVSLSVSDYTILGGSDADSVVTNGSTTITVTIASGQTFTLLSSAHHRLDNDGGFSSTCDTAIDRSKLVITSGTTKTVIVTPNLNVILCSSGSGPSSPGGGGSVAVASTPTPTPTVTPTPTISVTPVPSPVQNVVRANGTLVRYVGDPRVYVLEAGQKKWIATAEEFTKLGYKWQNIITLASSETYPTGSNKTSSVSSSAIAKFITNIAPGSRGAIVSSLQQRLKDLGYLPANHVVTQLFGPVTRAAVVKLQKANGLPQVGNVGPMTRGILNR